MTRLPVITGLGVVSPLGVGIESFWAALRDGRSAIARLSSATLSSAPECRIAAEVHDFKATNWMEPRLVKNTGRFSQFAVAAARMAAIDSGLQLTAMSPDRVTVSVGTSMSGVTDVLLPHAETILAGETTPPWGAREYPGHAATAHVAHAIGAAGSWATISTACGAGMDSIAWAAERIEAGLADVVIAGGTETPLSPVTLEAFRLFGLLSRWSGDPAGASRPFDRFRTGLVVGEGAAAVVVEEECSARARGARIYARISAAASAAEITAGHLEMSGATLARCILETLRRGRRRPEDLDYISAHGAGIPSQDVAETAGIKAALGNRAYSVPVSSIKSMCGQAFAATSATQVVAACLSLVNGIVTPTINYDEPDPLCDLDYVPNIARTARLRTALVHARSMGGSHTTMLLERART